MTAELPKPLRGIITPMVTPLLDHDTLDVPGLERLIEHILAGGVHGLFILGTTGEAPSLSHRLRRELIERVCRQVAGRLPVLVGVTDTSFVESVNLACFARQAGAAAVVLAAPFYFPAGQPELSEYLQHIVPQLPLPMVLYNMPGRGELRFEEQTVAAASRLPTLVGLKDSSADLAYFLGLLKSFTGRPDFSLWMGNENLLAEALLAGAHGGVCGGANVLPRLYVDLYNAALAGDSCQTALLHERVMHIRKTVYAVGRYGSGIIKGIKCALFCMGICSDFMAEPFHRFRQAERDAIRRHLVELGILKQP
jgi:4-hydroxy-tetrahydrodipicolinate synthase